MHLYILPDKKVMALQCDNSTHTQTSSASKLLTKLVFHLYMQYPTQT